MNKNNVWIAALCGVLAACGGDKSGGNQPAGDSSHTSQPTTQHTPNPEPAAQEVPLKSSEEVAKARIYATAAEVEQEADKSSILRFKDSQYRLPEFPAALLQAKNLQVLALQSFAGQLPENIGDFKNLTTLYLAHAELKSLPASIAQLKHLKALSLDGCRGLDLAQTIELLKQCPSLEALEISNMKLQALPDNIGDLAGLKLLRIGGNADLKAVPASFFKLAKLEELSMNSIPAASFDYAAFFTQCKEAMPNLRRLSLQYCGLTKGLPAVLKDFPNLQEVQWYEEGKGWENSDKIIATAKKEDEKFPCHVTWNGATGLLYDYY